MSTPGALVPLSPTLPAEASEALAWAPAIDAFVRAGCDSEHTRRAYRRHLTVAAEAFAAAGVDHLDALRGHHLAAYREWVTQPGRGLAPSSQGQALAAMRSFLK